MLGEPTIIPLEYIEYTVSQPYSRNHRGELIQSPYIVIKNKDLKLTILGKKVMWSYFDALFSDNPLPRQAVNDDIFCPDVHSPSLYSLLQDFTKESVSEGTEYLIAYHVDGNITYVEPFNSGIITDVEMMCHYLKSEGYKPLVKPFIYRGNNVSIRPSIAVNRNGWDIELVDIGKRWYMRSSGVTEEGISVGLLPPQSIMKQKKNDIAIAFKQIFSYADLMKPILGQLTPLPLGLKTHEHDRLLVNRRSNI